MIATRSRDRGNATVHLGAGSRRAAGTQLWRCLALALGLLLLMGGVARAAVGPKWEITPTSDTTAQPGAQFTFYVDARNVGDTSTDGSTYTLTVTLPSGMTGASASGFDCPGVAGATTVVCTLTGPLTPFIVRQLVLTVNVDPGASGVETAAFDLRGGGAAEVRSADPVVVTPALPSFGIDAFDARVDADAAGDPLTQAGGHPYAASVSFDVNTADDPSPNVGPLRPVEALKDVVTELPAGFVGNPTSVAKCTVSDLANTPSPVDPEPLCAPSSQVGVAELRASGQGGGPNVFGPFPLFNVVPAPDEPARFGFNALGTVVMIDLNVRSGSDYGVTATVHDASEGLAVIGTTLTLWGVPSDPSHDLERACPGRPNPWLSGPSCTSSDAPAALLRNPTSCTDPGVGLPTTVRMDSWQNPGAFVQATSVSHLPPGYPFAPADWGPPQGTDGCDGVPFDPVFRAQPLAGATAGAPAPFAFDLTLPQSDAPDAVGEADLRKAVVTLPAGVRVSPSSADGLQGCSSDQIALGSEGDPTCPDASKIGSVAIDTPLLDQQVKGGIYLATPFDNPFHSLLAIYLVARASGVVLKLPGEVSADPVTGQITTTFDNQPQLPFSRLHLEFKSGPRAPLALPDQCGLYVTHAELTGWNGRTVSQDSTFAMSENANGQPCPAKFSPGFSAGTASSSAGSSSSFLLRFTRGDDDQELKALTVHLPGGLTGKIANAVLCPDTAATAGACTDGSKIGDVTVGAGAGSNPFFITNGRAYLTGPYKGAPFGVSIVVPAVAGPFDLGNVVVRSALFVDKHDATVSIVSDPLPAILQGIPLDVRDVRVNVDKPGFFVNPTSCAVKTITGTLSSTGGMSANVSDRFQAADCASLGFTPRMALSVGGVHHTHPGQTTPLTTRITMPSGNANLRFVRVTLPKTMNARLTVIGDACTRAEFESDVAKCAHARAGTAVAATPLLRDPLRGNVYFVKNGHALPDLFIALRGQVAFDLIGQITIVNSTRLRTTFPTAPDVPIRSFTLRLFGDSKHGSLGALSNLCTKASRAQKAQIDYIGQNGKVRQVDQAMTVHGCPKAKAKPRHRHKRG